MALSDTAVNSTGSNNFDIDAARELIAAARLITVLTGAGVSTASGIPDFRGPQGLWTKDPKAARMFDIDAYVADRDIRVLAWRNRRDHPAWTAQPNAAHHAIADLERRVECARSSHRTSMACIRPREVARLLRSSKSTGRSATRCAWTVQNAVR